MVDFKKLNRIINSPFQKHRRKWQQCQLCDLCKTRKQVVLCRGKVPADILMIGKTPGISEDVVGLPFIGPAGHLLDQIIERAWRGRYDFCLTNIIGCVPLGEDLAKADDPPESAIKACMPRVQELVLMCRPKLIVTVGKLADKWVPRATERLKLPEEMKPPKWCSIIHPAHIIRLEPAQVGLAVQRSVVLLENAVAGL